MDYKFLQQLISEIYSKSNNIQIGLQMNAFKIPSTFVPIMNNVTWVTHRINPLSDATLAIFYQWASFNPLKIVQLFFKAVLLFSE